MKMFKMISVFLVSILILIGYSDASNPAATIEIGRHDELFMASEDTHSDETHTGEDEEDAEHTEESGHDDHGHEGIDPHIWLDPLRMIEISRIIKDELIAINPGEEATYNENSAALEDDLIELDQEYIDALEEKTNKQLLVSHAAFGYWEAKQYELEYVLYEQNTSNRVTKVIQEQIGAEALTIHNLSVLTEEDIENEEDYISLMNYNLDIPDKAIK